MRSTMRCRPAGRRAGAGLAVAALVLAGSGCGEEASPPNPSKPGATGASTATSDHRVVGVLTRTDAGGRATDRLSAIGDRQALLRYVERFRGAGRQGDALAEDIVSLARRTPAAEGRELAAAVVRVGCGAPTPAEVTVEIVDGLARLEVPPAPAGITCAAAETSVAVVDLPAEVLPEGPDPTRSIDPPDPT